jgi:glycosyltransferase involved in cell wall biosynthesis
MSDRRSIVVVTPVFNEEEVIGLFFERTTEVLKSIEDRFEWRIVFVVDRCSDRTLEILRKIAALDGRVQVLALSARFGHQMSLLAGVDNAGNADAVIMMDSDLQHPPEIIPVLVDRFLEGADVVYTVRADTEDVSGLRKWVGSAFYRLLGRLSDTPIHENAADFRLISRRVCTVLQERIRERGLFLRGVLNWIGYKQVSVEYRAAKRAAGRSKYSLSRMMALATAGILSFSTKPLRLGIGVGISFALIGFFLGAMTVAEYFFDRSLPSGWTTIVTLLLLFSGVQLIFMGIIGAYIGGIYEEVKGRPHYLIEEAINIEPKEG